MASIGSAFSTGMPVAEGWLWVPTKGQAMADVSNATYSFVRPPLAAGFAYPNDPDILQRQLAGYLAAANLVGPQPKALIVPRDGLGPSGAVSAAAYALLRRSRERIRRVVLIGPSAIAFQGLALTAYDAFATPLGRVRIDRRLIREASRLPHVEVGERAHLLESGLESQLPWLQAVLGSFTLIPILAGHADMAEVADVLTRLWGAEETLIVATSNLSRSHDYWTARAIDSDTSNLIEQGQWRQVSRERACGNHVIGGLLKAALERGLAVKTLGLRNSGDMCRGNEPVIGYGAYVLFPRQQRYRLISRSC